MRLTTILFSASLMFGLVGCGDTKKPSEPAKPEAKQPAPQADPPAKVDIHVHTDTATKPEPKHDGLSIEIGADVELK